MMPLRYGGTSLGTIAAMLMNHDRVRVVDYFPARPMKPHAKINILEIQEEPLVEQLLTRHGLLADEHRST